MNNRDYYARIGESHLSHRSLRMLLVLLISIAWSLSGTMAKSASAATFDFEASVSGSGTKTVQQTVGSDTMVITATDETMGVGPEADVIGPDVAGVAGQCMGVALDANLDVVTNWYESKIRIEVSGGKVFDLSSFTVADTWGESKNLKITTNKGSQTYSADFVELSWSVTPAGSNFQGITYAEITTSDASNQFGWAFDNIVLSNITAPAPTVTSVSVPGNATYVADQNLDFTVSFSEAVTVVTTGGTPYIPITLDTGGTVNAAFLSGSGTSALVFRYTVVSGNADTNGITVGSAITAAGGTLKDAAGNDATLTLNSIGATTAILVDAIPPVLTAPTTTNIGANIATLILQSSATGTGYITVLSGSGTACGTGTQVKNGQAGTGAAAFRIGSLPLTADTSGSYTVRNLTESTNYTVCFTASGGDLQATPATVNFTTTAAINLSNVWTTVGGAGFSAGQIVYTSLAFAPDGTPYVAYRDGAVSKVTVMMYSSGTWTTVGSAGFSSGVLAKDISLVFAPDGTPYVAYSDKISNIYKAAVKKYDGASWVDVGSGVVSAASALFTSLAFAPDGTPYVAYSDGAAGARATVMRYSSGSWTAVGNAGFSAGRAEYTSLAFAPDGTPYVAYEDYANGNKGTVMKYDGTSWVAVGSTGFTVGYWYAAIYTSLSFAPDGSLFIAYVDFFDYNTPYNNAAVMRFTDGGWQIVLSPDSSRSAYIVTPVSFAPDGWTTYLARNPNPNSMTTTIPLLINMSFEISGVTGSFVSLSIAPDGSPYMAYQDGNGMATVKKLAPAYTVTYDGNGNTGGSVPTDSNKYVEGATVTVSADTNGLAKTGYDFAGWNTAANDSGASYAAGATFAMGAADVTLYAKWRVNTTVTSVTVPGNGTYIAGQDLDFTVNWSEDVTVTGTDSTLGLTIGSSSRTAGYLSKTDASITYRYTVQTGDLDTDGIAMGSLTLNATTIRNSGNFNAVLTLNSVGSTEGVLVDAVAPTVVIASTASNPTNSAFGVTIAFSEPVSGFAVEDISVGNGTASNFSGSGASYTATIAPSSDGSVTVNIAAGVAQDAAGNGNTVAAQLSRTYDHTSPAVVISAPSPISTISGAVTYTVTYSDTNFSASTLAAGNITLNLTGTADATTVAVTGSGATRTVSLSGITGTGTIGISIAAGTASDTAGNTAPTAGPSTAFNVMPSVLYAEQGGRSEGLCGGWDEGCELQYILGIVPSGSELWVKAGTYKPTTGADRTASFELKNGVAIYGGFAGNESARDQRNIAANPTVLSGDIGTTGDSSDNTYHVVTNNGTDNTAILDGFVITDGNANGGFYPDDRGGGVLNYGNAVMSNVTVSGNSASYGGGMYSEDGSPTITNATFSNNQAVNFGGGMENYYSDTALANVTFSGNSAAGSGGGMYNEGGNPTLENATFSGNTSAAGGGINNVSSSPTLTNSIIWGNTGGQISSDGESAPVIAYSIVQGGYDGTGNSGSDPLLDPSGLQDNGGPTQTIALLAGSPAINAGADCPATDQRGVSRSGVCDIGAYEFVSATTTTVSSSSNSSSYGTSVTFTTTVADSELASTPTGTVTFKDDGADIGAAALDGANQATFTTSLLSAGSHTITAVYAGDSNFSGSISGSLAQLVSKASQVITFNALQAKTYGEADFSPGASASSGLTISYTSSNTSVATIVGGNIHIVGGGTTTITALQAGDSDYNAATSVSQSLVVNKAAATVTLGSLSATYDGTAKSATAATNPSGLTVTFTYGGSATAPTNAGSFAVVGTITDANYAGTSIGTLVIAKATPSITAWPTASAITYGQTLASSSLTGGSSTPAGSFTFTTPGTSPNAGTASQGVMFTPTDTDNYNTSSSTVNVTVNKATPSVSAWPTASTITYGQTLASSSLTGGSSTPAGSFTFTTPGTSPNAGTASQGVTFTPTDTDNYNTSSSTVNVTVNKATPSVSAWPTASSITYGQTLADSTLTGGSSTPAGSFAFTTPGTSPNAGTASQGVTFTPTDTTNYNTASGTASVTVSKATPSVSAWPTASAITYGQTLADATLSGGASTPAGSFAFTTPTTAPNAGTASQGVTFTPTDTTNYNTATGTVSVTVNKATSIVTLGSLTATYDGTVKSATATTDPAGLTVTFTYDGSAAAQTNAGSYAVVGTISDANYTGTANGTLLIGKATPSVTSWPSAGAITYGQTLAESTLAGGSSTPEGSFAFTTPGTSPNAGTASQSVTFTPTDTINYNTATGTVSVTVNKATPTVSAWPTASSLTYGQSLADATLSGGASTPAGSFAFTTPGTSPNAGTASQGVTFTSTDTDNYNTASGTVSVTVNKATPTVSEWPTASTITYGQSLADSTLTGGSSTPEGSFAFTTPGTAPNAGTASQGVTFTPTDTDNYNTATGTVSVTVNKATATVTLGDLTATYDGTAKSATATTDPAGLTVIFTHDGSATAPTNAGSYAVVGTISDANYTGTANGTLVIGKATPSVTSWPSAGAITYGQTLADATLSGGASTPAGSFAFTTPGTSPNAGTASQGVTFTSTDTDNYNTASGTVSVTVNKATPSVSAWPTASTITYGQTLADSTLTGGSSTPEGSFAFTIPSTAPNAGTASQGVTFTPTDTTNYNTASGTASVTVNKATPSVSAWPTASSITYGQTLADSSLTGGSSTPNGSFAFTIPSTAPSAGTASQGVTFTPTDTTNYNTASGTASVTVNKATPTVSEWPTASTITYGQTLADSSLTSGSSTPNGSFAFTIPSTAPSAGTASQGATFTPTDATNYNTATGTVSVTVNKATPTVSAWPTASSITYGQSLADSTLTGGSSTPAGSFAFTTPSTSPSAGTTSQGVTFMPTDTGNYNTASSTVNVTVNKATPTVSAWPTASSITYGQTLAESTLTGGSASVNGSFAFTAPGTAPNAGTASQGVTFTPTDTTNYNTATSTVSVAVNKATPTVSAWPTANSITYGRSLADSTLTGGSASVGGSFAFTTPSTSPNAGTASQGVTFTPTDTDNYNTSSSTVNVTVNKATPSVSAWPTASSITYGQTLADSTLTGGSSTPAGSFTFTTPGTSPNAGTASQGVTFTPTDIDNYNTASGTVNVTVNKATASVTLGSLTATYDGTAKSATATTDPAGLTFTFTYDGSATAPTNAGSYTVVGTISDSNYQGTASGTLVIDKGATAITVAQQVPSTAVYNTSFSVAATASSGLDVAITTSGACSGGGAGSAAITVTGGTESCTVHYNQSGDGNHNAAQELTQSVTVLYTVTPSAGADGTISPDTAQTVTYGQTISFTVTPDTGYHLSSVSGCDGTLTGNTYTTGPITADCAVTASFVADSAPTVPALSAPSDADEVTTQTPNLIVNASTDVDGDPVSYIFELDTASSFDSENRQASGVVDSVTWTPETLADNTTWYWRARATDGTASSGWMSTARFFVNTQNDAPAVPGISSPADNVQVDALTPALTVTNALDIDGDALTYEFEVYANSNYIGLISSATGISQAGGGETSWTVDTELDDFTTYYWRARARDEHNLAGDWASAAFFTNTVNVAPTAPTLSAPASGSEITGTVPVLTANNATDVNNDSLSYIFEIDRVNTFDSPDKQTSGVVGEGSGTTSWTPAALLDNTTWYWRAKANDGLTDGPWMATASLFVNMENDAPGIPTILNPAEGSDVTVLNPTLSVSAAIDIDNDSLTYDFKVYGDSGLTSLVSSATEQGASWVVSPDLSDNTMYWWIARAIDKHGLAGDWMAAGSFFVNYNGVNDAPAITLMQPEASEPVVTGDSFTITWTDSDPDSDAVITLGYDTTGSGCSGTQIATGLSEDNPANSHTWYLAALPVGTYHIYAVIDDGATSACSYAPGTLVRVSAALLATPSAGAGGSLLPSVAQEVAYGDTVSFTVTAAAGYTIDQVAGCGGSLAGDIYTTGAITADCTVTATFSINTYTVTFDLAGGTWIGGGELTQTIAHGQAAVAPEFDQAEGKTFTGWSAAFDNITADTTVTAQYAYITYTLTYIAGANGSITGTSPQTVSHGADGSAVTAVPAANHHFVNWSDGSTANPRTDTNVTADISVTANFAINTHTVTFNLAGGTRTGGGELTQTVTHGQAAVAPEFDPPAGKTFTGWSAAFDSITAYTTVTAQYAGITYTVTFNSNGGSAVGNIIADYGAPISAPAEPTRAGYAFAGWYKEAELISAWDFASDTVTGGVTLFAKWDEMPNSAPTVPTLASPGDASEVTTQTPELAVNAATDVDGDPVSYIFEVDTASSFDSENRQTSGAVSTTTWTPETLADNTTWFWRARATDGSASSAWMPTASFFVNTENDAPTAPGISSPADDGQVDSLRPTLTVTNASDIDGDALTYEFEVYETPSYTGDPAASAAGISLGEGGATSWTVDAELTDYTTYYWRVRARDEHNLEGDWVNGAFFANTVNAAPTAPTLASPATGGETASVTPSLTVANATDLNRDSLSYVFEIDRVNTFDSPDKQTSRVIAEGSGTTNWTPEALADNTTWFWRAKANDGMTEGPWMTVSSLFVNTENDAPGIPALLNPADGSDVTMLNPTLSVNAAIDIDSDGLTYEFRVYEDSGLTSLVTSTIGAGASWLVTADLSDNKTYWWTARAVDEHGLAGDWMAAASFFVNENGYDDPPAITITKPGAAGPLVYGTSFTIGWNAHDPDSVPMMTLGYDETGSGCRGTVIATGIIAKEGADQYEWDITSLPPGTYYVYASVSDESSTVCVYGGGSLLRSDTTGDINGDGVVDVADALKALRIAAGVVTPTSSELSRGDVAPLVNGKPQPDGVIDIGDVVVILRKTVGLVSW